MDAERVTTKTIWRVVPYLRRRPFLTLGTFLCAIAGTVTVLALPTVTKLIIDDVVMEHKHERLVELAALGALAVLLQQGLNALRILLNNRLEQHVIFDLRSDLYLHMQLVPLRWFDHQATGDLMTRVIEDVNAVERLLIDGIEQGGVAALQILVVVGFMFYLNPTLAIIALAPLPLLVSGALCYTIAVHKRYRIQRRAASALNSVLHDNLSGIRQIKSYVREKEEHARFNRVSNELRTAALSIMNTWATYSPSMALVDGWALVIVLTIGARGVLNGSVQVGDFVASILLVGLLYEPIRLLHHLNQLLQGARAAGARVFEILDEPIETGRGHSAQSERFVGDIRFDDVSFSYIPGVLALSHVSFHAPRGAMIALVGTTGAGKSTVASLLVRFYDATAGQISIDGKSIYDVSITTTRESIGVVTQESFLFNGTIRENLLIGKSNSTDQELWSALEAANARAFVERLPGKLDSAVGERGVKLSVGEKQRLSITRMVLKDPPILILDEATASVDTVTERLIQRALDDLMMHRTSIVIAHRLSTVTRADEILVFEHGQIVERGTHVDLIAARGAYALLCDHAFMDCTVDDKRDREVV